MTYSMFYVAFTVIAFVLAVALDIPIELDGLELLVACGILGICHRLDKLIDLKREK